jgi:hypothetical protein
MHQMKFFIQRWQYVRRVVTESARRLITATEVKRVESLDLIETIVFGLHCTEIEKDERSAIKKGWFFVSLVKEFEVRYAEFKTDRSVRSRVKFFWDCAGHLLWTQLDDLNNFSLIAAHKSKKGREFSVVRPSRGTSELKSRTALLAAHFAK